MKKLLISVGDYDFFDEPSNKGGLIGGKITAINPDNTVSKNYKNLHTGKTDKYNVLAKLILELVPPEDENEKDNTEKEFNDMDATKKEQ